MKICWNGFLAKNHSWSIVAQNICRQLIKQNHQVHLFSTNGLQFFPDDLKPNLIGYVEENVPGKVHGRVPDNNYDCQLSYTVMKNFPLYFRRGNKNRFGIWCYEWNVLPPGFAKQHIHVNRILAPSKFAQEIFVNNGVPSQKLQIVPHGINLNDYQKTIPYKLKTNKSKKIFVNIGQPHRRKRIDGMFQAFGEAFKKNDDVCLVAKISAKKNNLQNFEVNVFDIYQKFKKQYPNAAEIELITDYVSDIASLYAAIDIVFTMSYCEGFYMPGLEALACNKINVAPRYGGQLDFLNDDNSLLIDGKLIRADAKMQYWEPSPLNGVFEADIQQAAEKLRFAVDHYDECLNKFSHNMNQISQNYTWEKVTNQILNLCE